MAARLANFLSSLETVSTAKLNPADPLFDKKQEDREEAGRSLSDLPKLTIMDAEAAADQWFERLRRRIAQKEPAKDATTLMAGQGFRVVRIGSTAGLDIFMVATGPDVYLLSASDGSATIEVGADGVLVGLWSDLPAARTPVCCRLLNLIARRGRPSTGATSSLARVGLYHDGERFVTLEQALDRTPGTRFLNGDRLVTMVNRETSQETLWYVRGGKLAAILTTNAAGGGNRLYVAEASDEFSGSEVAGNVFRLLERRNALLADSTIAARLGLVFFALIGRYTTLEGLAEVATEALTDLDGILALEHVEGCTTLRLNRRLRHVADVRLDGAGRITPFLAVDAVVGDDLCRDFKWVLSVLNALGVAAGHGDVGGGIFFHRATRLFMSRDAFMATGGPGGATMADLRRMVATSWRKTAAAVRSLAPDD